MHLVCGGQGAAARSHSGPKLKPSSVSHHTVACGSTVFMYSVLRAPPPRTALMRHVVLQTDKKEGHGAVCAQRPCAHYAQASTVTAAHTGD